MALGSRLPCNLGRNTLPVNPINDKLAGTPEAPTKSTSSPAPTSQSLSWGPTPGFTFVPAFVSAAGPAHTVG